MVYRKITSQTIKNKLIGANQACNSDHKKLKLEVLRVGILNVSSQQCNKKMTKVINDPLGQAHSHDNSEHYSHLSMCFVLLVLKVGWTDNTCEYIYLYSYTSVGWPCGSKSSRQKLNETFKNLLAVTHCCCFFFLNASFAGSLYNVVIA